MAVLFFSLDWEKWLSFFSVFSATGLSAGAVAGIAVSTVLVIGAALIGYCCYCRHYRQPADTPFQQFEDFGGEGGYDNESVSSDSM